MIRRKLASVAQSVPGVVDVAVAAAAVAVMPSGAEYSGANLHLQ